MTWTPHIRLDLNTASARAFADSLETFEEWRSTQEQRPIDLSNGWKTITPEIAEAMLLRNPLTANRRPTLSTIQYYARQMLKGDWKKTGQALLFSRKGALIDAGHRLWACYLSGATFETFVIGDVEDDQPNLFAYIDNGKARSGSDALATAGLNGQSKLLAQMVTISHHYERDAYTPSSKKQMERLSPADIIAYVTERPNMRTAARIMGGEHKTAVAIIGFPDVAAFVAFQILELHDDATLDEFMIELEDRDTEHLEGSPVAALQKVLDNDKNAKEPMKKHQILGHVIKGFNSWIKKESVKKLTLPVNADFPRFVGPQSAADPIHQQAAE